MSLPRLAILGSGQGSNFIALREAIENSELPAVIALVVSDQPTAPILSHAVRFRLATATLPPSPFRTKLSPEGEAELLARLRQAQVDWVILAGYMRVIKEPLLSAYAGRIVNIHPSLLPAFPGLRAWDQALAAGATTTGCTIHFVSAAVDAGEIIAQEAVPILPGDTSESLHARIQEAEHRLYPATLAKLFRAAPLSP